MTATSRSMTTTGPTLAAANWAGDCLDREYLMSAGAKLDNSLFGSPDAFGRLTIPSGTVIGRTYAERDAHTPMGPAADTDDEVFIIAFDVTDANVNDDVEVTRHNAGLQVKENFLPGFSSLSAAVKAKVRASYVCTIGVS
jgi:hypothetical protein